MGAVMEKLGTRKGEHAGDDPASAAACGSSSLSPARGLFGYRNEFLTDTRGEGIMSQRVRQLRSPIRVSSTRRNTGSLVAFETGESITYGLFNAQERGALFIGAGVDGV